MSQNRDEKKIDWQQFYEELQSESERGAVIIAGAVLDTLVRDVIEAFLVDDPKVVSDLLGSDKKVDCALSTFSSRIRTAYCLGLISKAIYDDLNRIRKIRNKFAHQMHGYSFDEPEIVSWCNHLYMAKIVTDALPHFPKGHREMFLLGVSQLASSLALKKLAVARERRSVPKDPEMGEVVRVGGDD